MIKKLVRLAIIVIVAIILQIAASRYALDKRGYEAIGGEALVFPFVLIIGSCMAGLFKREK